jgi:hypothetical protein
VDGFDTWLAGVKSLLAAPLPTVTGLDSSWQDSLEAAGSSAPVHALAAAPLVDGMADGAAGSDSHTERDAPQPPTADALAAGHASGSDSDTWSGPVLEAARQSLTAKLSAYVQHADAQLQRLTARHAVPSAAASIESGHEARGSRRESHGEPHTGRQAGHADGTAAEHQTEALQGDLMRAVCFA